ncbi:MAG: glycoside hydrolase family 15 protein [Longimicrobiales bacterium]
MPKDIPVGNGNLLLNFDLHYRIRDVYFPRIGQENHAGGHEFRFGVWADGRFSWMGPEWEIDLRYADDTLVTDVRLANGALRVELRCRDAVDVNSNVYVRLVEVRDLEGRERDVRLFFSHDFRLYGNEIGDTAYFDPRTQAIIHYKINRYFLVGCRGPQGLADAFSCGARAAPGRQPSWKDAEDGEVNRSPIAWGFAESTIGVRLHVPPGGTEVASYWLAAGTRYEEVAHLNELAAEKTPHGLVERTADYWKAWVGKDSRSFGDLPKAVTDIFNRSLLVLRTQIDNRGAIIAANDSDIVRFGGDTYSYVWGRDGAFVAVALEKAGYSALCRGFFEFCRHALSEDGYLFQHYNPDGSLASNWHPWLLDGKQVLPIQEDSTALILWALWIHYEGTRDVEFIRPLYEPLILKTADFLVSHRDRETLLPLPSFDLWEERYGVHAYTVAAVIAGLRGAAKFGRLFNDAARARTYETAADQMALGIANHLYHPGLGRYARSGHRTETGYELDEVIDVSLLGLATLGALPLRDVRIANTVEAVRRELSLATSVGGLARYRDDSYQREADVPKDVPGNPWFIATLWLAEVLIARSDTVMELHEALPHLEWCVRNALPSGVLAEQVHPVSGCPLSVSPLTWSHSAFVRVALQYGEKREALG